MDAGISIFLLLASLRRGLLWPPQLNSKKQELAPVPCTIALYESALELREGVFLARRVNFALLGGKSNDSKTDNKINGVNVVGCVKGPSPCYLRRGTEELRKCRQCC